MILRQAQDEQADGFAALAARLTARAEAIGQAIAVSRLLARRDDPSRWRRPRLLWPQFTKG